MVEENINTDIMEYMVWVVEITSVEFFKKDKTRAYETLKNSGLWNIYTTHYETTHTLGKEYFIEHGVKIA